MYIFLVITTLTFCIACTGGPYEAFGGRDASRALARFAVDEATDKYDDLSDLNTTEMNSIKEWEEQFKGEPQLTFFKSGGIAEFPFHAR